MFPSNLKRKTWRCLITRPQCCGELGVWQVGRGVGAGGCWGMWDHGCITNTGRAWCCPGRWTAEAAGHQGCSDHSLFGGCISLPVEAMGWDLGAQRGKLRQQMCHAHPLGWGHAARTLLLLLPIWVQRGWDLGALHHPAQKIAACLGWSEGSP